MKRAVIITMMVLIGGLPVAHFVYAQAESAAVQLRRAQLESELARIEIEIEAERKVLQEKQKESVSLERDITILNSSINKARLGIRARNLTIAELVEEINAKSYTIGELTEKMDREKESLAQLMRKTNEIDSFSLVEVVLNNRNISDFFIDLDAFESLKASLNASFDEIRGLRNETEEERNLLEEKKSEEVDLRTIQEREKAALEEDENEKAQILDVTKGEEAAYQKIISSKEKTAAEIRTELFSLRGSTDIPFERALQLAKWASQQTGVRPAFLLGIIAEESNLGQNVGTGNWREDMHPDRDVPVFMEITKRLGFNPDDMPVSKKPWYGWGGAMGPAQFIPSTWILYEDKIAEMTGHNPPNPWDPGDAFMASALLLKDNGAARGGYSNERLAALRYFAGWKNAEKPSYAFYGDEVMELAAKYQRMIDVLENS